ncbi:Peptidase M16 inactive domain protein [Novipirellula galeiformis]|uniref:Peptidase M16 inactive domain protein n=1 Tax=Novipirellula galeiformis TaxID=2528004 RepID=A0A5C6CAM8_9BACT|nr:pitrilysin family protein [Novipirellula galeiformis]TWU21640.1 Peptidase M16 inactive domain protein [Novipirellula galeiformis]
MDFRNQVDSLRARLFASHRRRGLLALWVSVSVVTSVIADQPQPSPSAKSPPTQSSTPVPTKVTELEGISEYTFENGVRVLLFPDESKEVVTVNMTVLVGSRHEGYGEAGMAHLLEHMLFKGTPTFPEVPKALTDRGARFNGTTWLDRTNYYETLPASDENLRFALDLESDRLLNSFVRGEDLASEMTVVRNEFERGENSPIRVLMQRMQSAAFDWHNYGQSTIGNRSDIERVPVVKLRQFYKKYYRPDNVMLIVAGKFDPEFALQQITETFGVLKSPDTPIDSTYTTEPPQDGERTVVLRRVGDVQYVGAAYHIPSGSHADYAAMKALVYVLGDEPSGRLYKQMVEAKIASNVFTLAYGLTEPGLFMGIAEIPEEHSIEQARQTLIDIIEKSLSESPITEQEVERAKQQILKERELESSDTDKIAVALSDWAAQGDWRLYLLYRDRIENLTVAQVQEAAKKYFVRNNRTVGLFIPSEQSERVAIPESPNLVELFKDYEGREAVAAGEMFDPAPLAIEARTTRGELVGGIRYAMLPKKTRGGSVTLNMTLRFGTGETLKGKIGAVELLGMLMAKGTRELDYQQFQDELTRLRAELSISSTVGLLQLQVKTKKEFLPEVVQLIGKVLREPRLSSEELEVIRRQVITSLQQSKNEPQALAPLSVRKRLAPYESDNVLYVQSIDEQLQMYSSVTADQIKQLHDNFLGNQAGEVAAVGDFDAEELQSWIAKELNDWTVAEPYVRVDRNPHPETEGSLEAIETPDKANAFFYSSEQYELNDADPAYASLVLGNFILGGGSLSSRLADRVRQQEGLSYGVRSSVIARARDNRVDFTLYAITNPANREKLIRVIREEIDRIRQDGITSEELQKAKLAYLQRNRVSRADDSSLASELLSTIFNERTMAYEAEHEAQIEAATVESVNDAIRTYIQPENLVMAIAGDFANVKEENAKE